VRHLEEQFDVHWGQCLSYGEGITYWPIAEIFKSAAGILQSDDRDTSQERLGAFLSALATAGLDELRTIGPALSHPIGMPTTAPRARAGRPNPRASGGPTARDGTGLAHARGGGHSPRRPDGRPRSRRNALRRGADRQRGGQPALPRGDRADVAGRRAARPRAL